MKEFQWDVEELRLITGGKGVFDVRLGDEMLFSKYEADRFPEYAEVRQKLVAILGEPPDRD